MGYIYILLLLLLLLFLHFIVLGGHTGHIIDLEYSLLMAISYQRGAPNIGRLANIVVLGATPTAGVREIYYFCITTWEGEGEKRQTGRRTVGGRDS
jgi:hypothetical protein